jgi:hypothetical protein
MINPNMVPILDPNPLPAPYWVFKLLLVVTFFLHILAMNFVLGGAVMALAARWRSKSNPYNNRVFLDVAKKVPSLLAATITIGIAPLLFVQVLYGQYFYTSSIILAWPWFLVLVFLIAAYYGFYFVSYKGERRPDVAGRVMLLSVILVLIIGFIYSNNLMLSQVPLGSKVLCRHCRMEPQPIRANPDSALSAFHDYSRGSWWNYARSDRIGEMEAGFRICSLHLPVRRQSLHVLHHGPVRDWHLVLGQSAARPPHVVFRRQHARDRPSHVRRHRSNRLNFPHVRGPAKGEHLEHERNARHPA